jgi:signal transduction histidine kinase
VTTHLSAMIEEILAFTSLEEGTRDRPSDRVPRRGSRALRPRRGRADGRAARHRARAQAPSTAVRMSSDIEKARQIIVNLLGNA